MQAGGPIGAGSMYVTSYTTVYDLYFNGKFIKTFRFGKPDAHAIAQAIEKAT